MLMNGQSATGIVGAGNEFQVFSSVVQAIQQFMSSTKVTTLDITIDRVEIKRSSVYERLMKRLLPPNWLIAKYDEPHCVRFSMYQRPGA